MRYDVDHDINRRQYMLHAPLVTMAGSTSVACPIEDMKLAAENRRACAEHVDSQAAIRVSKIEQAQMRQREAENKLMTLSVYPI